MTNGFSQRYNEALTAAEAITKRGRDAALDEFGRNMECVEMYKEVVLAFIRVFDFKSCNFFINLITEDLSKTIGRPFSIRTQIDNNQKAHIYFYYCRDWKGISMGLPDFLEKKAIKLGVVNNALEEDDINVSTDFPDDWNYRTDSITITFDASLLLSRRDELFHESSSGKKIILTQEAGKNGVK